MFLLHGVSLSPVRFVNRCIDFCGCLVEGNLNIVREVSCWLAVNESDVHIFHEDICDPKRGRTIIRRTLWLLFFSRPRMLVNVAARNR